MGLDSLHLCITSAMVYQLSYEASHLFGELVNFWGFIWPWKELHNQYVNVKKDSY